MTLKNLTLQQTLELDILLSGFSNGQTNVKGILSEKINIKTKYWLTKIKDQVDKEKQRFNELREELIKKYGEPTQEGGYEIKQIIEGKANPSILAFTQEINELLSSEIELSFPSLDLEAFDFESENDYSALIKYVCAE